MLKVKTSERLNDEIYSFKDILAKPGVYSPLCNKSAYIIIPNKWDGLPILFVWNGTVCTLDKNVWKTEHFIKSQVTITFSNED